MKRKMIVIVLLAFGVMTILAACKLPWELPPDDFEPTDTPTDFPTTRPTTEPNALPTEISTLAPTSTSTPTATPTATATALPAGKLVILDGVSDAVDCVDHTALATSPAEIDILTVLLEGDLENVRIQLGFQPEFDIAAAIASLKLPYSIQIGITDPEFPLPPADPDVLSANFQNAAYLIVWLNSLEPIANISSQYRDGVWSQLPGPSPAGVAFTGVNTATVTIPNAALPQAGSIYVISVIDNRICDPAGVDEQGPAVQFEVGEGGYLFIKREE